MGDDGVLAGCGLALLAAAIVVVAAWLTFPRGREPAIGRAALVFGLAFLGTPIALLPLFPLAGIAAALPPVPQALAQAFLLAALPEEAWKGLLVWLLLLRHRRPRCLQDGAFYGLVAGMGFALVENFLYLASTPEAPDQLAFVRVVLAAPLHGAASALLGHRLFLAAAATPAVGRRHLAIGVVAAVALHGAYDGFLMVAAATETLWLALGGPLSLFVGLVAAGNAFLTARKLDEALRSRRGTGPLRG